MGDAVIRFRDKESHLDVIESVEGQVAADISRLRGSWASPPSIGDSPTPPRACRRCPTSVARRASFTTADT